MTFRTLTKKSRFNFGRYADYTVGDIIDIRQQREYVIWVYYNCSHISFMPEILEQCCIEPITKPGTAPEMMQVVNIRLREKIKQERIDSGKVGDYTQYNMNRGMAKFLKKARTNAVVLGGNKSAGVLMSRNHGHIKTH